MHITDVKVKPVYGDGKLRAYVTVEIDKCFVVRDLKVIQGPGGYFIAMPAKKLKDGSFRDLCHPVNKGTRQMLESAVMDEYFRIAAEASHRHEAHRTSRPVGHRYSGTEV